MLTPSLLLLACLAAPPASSPALPPVRSNQPAVPLPLRDCNGNGIEDGVDIGRGTSLDKNRNGVPDECEVLPLPSEPGVD